MKKNQSLVPQPLRTQSHINLISQLDISYYQRESDGYICLSTACQQLQEPSKSFFSSKLSLLVFLHYASDRPFPHKPTIYNLLSRYPDLLEADRHLGVESGLWLHPYFIPAFVAWSGQVRQKKWYLFAPDATVTPYLHNMQTSYYSYLINKPDDTRQIILRDPDGFVSAKNLVHTGIATSIGALLDDDSFLQALEQAASKLELKIDYEPMYDNRFPTSEGIYRAFRSLLDLTRSKNNSNLWIHPEVARIYARVDSRLMGAIDDWQARQEEGCYITLLSLPSQAKSNSEKAPSILKFRYIDTTMSIYEGEEYIYLKVNDAKYDWQFVVDLTDGRVFVDRDLLDFWMGSEVGKYLPDVDHFMAAKEIERGAELSQHPLVRLGNLVEAESINFQGEYWSVSIEDLDIVTQIKTPGCFTLVLQDVLATRKALIGNSLTVDQLRDRLAELGYISPYTSAIAPYQASAPIDPHAIVSSWEVNGELIRQRADGKIDATAMCRAYKKRLNNWLRTDDTYELFVARAKELSLEFKYSYGENTDFTRVAETFPALVERKSGSPSVGGGTWIDHKLTIHLAQWLDKDFALMVSDIVEEWMKNN